MPTTSHIAGTWPADVRDLLVHEIRERADHVQAILVTHGGELVVEHYFPGRERDLIWRPASEAGPGVELGEYYDVATGPDDLHNVKSVTKSVLATLVGIALDRGLIESIDRPVCEFLPEYFDGDRAADRRGITLRHLLQMRSGLEWVENGPITERWMLSPDLVAFTLYDQSVEAAPGARWNYSTADSHLLGTCLIKAAGEPLAEFARTHLFAPLGIDSFRWTVDPQGRAIGGSELFLRPRDMATFGELVRLGGLWAGRQIVSPEWIAEMTAPQPEVDAAVISATYAAVGLVWPDELPYHRRGYGYQWWRTEVDGHPTRYALGFGGQLIVVIDDLDLVVVQVCALREDIGPEEVPYRAAAAWSLIDDIVAPFAARRERSESAAS